MIWTNSWMAFSLILERSGQKVHCITGCLTHPYFNAVLWMAQEFRGAFNGQKNPCTGQGHTYTQAARTNLRPLFGTMKS